MADYFPDSVRISLKLRYVTITAWSQFVLSACSRATFMSNRNVRTGQVLSSDSAHSVITHTVLVIIRFYKSYYFICTHIIFQCWAQLYIANFQIWRFHQNRSLALHSSRITSLLDFQIRFREFNTVLDRHTRKKRDASISSEITQRYKQHGRMSVKDLRTSMR
jgi:hypothetical protein